MRTIGKDADFEPNVDLSIIPISEETEYHIQRSIFELTVLLRDPSTSNLDLDSMDGRVIDSFLLWWHGQPTTMYFSIRHLFINDTIYKTTMCDYLRGHPYRWLLFFMARTGIHIDLACDYVNDNSEHLLNFFYDQESIDRDIIVQTFHPSYTESLRKIQYEASERCVYIKLDIALLYLWLYGTTKFHKQYYAERNLSVDPKIVPTYYGKKLYIIDWD